MGQGAAWRVRFAVCSTCTVCCVFIQFRSLDTTRPLAVSNATQRAVSTKPVSQVGTLVIKAKASTPAI